MDEKKVALYLRQKKLLDTFLEKNAITQEQYARSLHDLTEKMGMQEVLFEEASGKAHETAGKQSLKTAYFAGGCFWCITPAFRSFEGVEKVISGYAGGQEVMPAYEDVKAQKTGHRETVAVTYDPEKVSFSQLLDIYLHDIDPFDAGGQFIDRGPSYTAAVFYTEAEEKLLTENALMALSEKEERETCVKVLPFTTFYPAEEYHQNWDLKHPDAFIEELYTSGRKKKEGENE